jgi:hypothetical protein
VYHQLTLYRKEIKFWVKKLTRISQSCKVMKVLENSLVFLSGGFMKSRKILFRKYIVALGLITVALFLTAPVSATTSPAPKRLAPITKPVTISPLSYATNQLVQSVLTTPVVNTAQKGSGLISKHRYHSFYTCCCFG